MTILDKTAHQLDILGWNMYYDEDGNIVIDEGDGEVESFAPEEQYILNSYVQYEFDELMRRQEESYDFAVMGTGEL